MQELDQKQSHQQMEHPMEESSKHPFISSSFSSLCGVVLLFPNSESEIAERTCGVLQCWLLLFFLIRFCSSLEMILDSTDRSVIVLFVWFA